MSALVYATSGPGTVARLHRRGCPDVSPVVVDASFMGVDGLLDAGRASCCSPTRDELRLAVLAAGGLAGEA